MVLGQDFEGQLSCAGQVTKVSDSHFSLQRGKKSTEDKS